MTHEETTTKTAISDLDLERLYHPNGHLLGSLFSGTSGSGKSTAIISTLQGAIASKKFGEWHRFVMVDPKGQPGDYDLLGEPLFDVQSVCDSIRKNRVTIFWPSMDFMEEEVSAVVDYVFDLARSEPRTTFTFVLDEAAVLITPTRMPLSLKRLSVQGRSLGIMPIYASQRPLLNRWTDANLSNMFLFRTLPLDADQLSKRWGVDFEEADARLREKPYSFLWFDMTQGTHKPMEPVALPKQPAKKKRTRWARFRALI